MSEVEITFANSEHKLVVDPETGVVTAWYGTSGKNHHISDLTPDFVDDAPDESV